MEEVIGSIPIRSTKELLCEHLLAEHRRFALCVSEGAEEC